MIPPELIQFFTDIAPIAQIIAAVGILIAAGLAWRSSRQTTEAMKKWSETMILPRILVRPTSRKEREILKSKYAVGVIIDSPGIRVENVGLGPAIKGKIWVKLRNGEKEQLLDETELMRVGEEKYTFLRIPQGVSYYYPSSTAPNLKDILEKHFEGKDDMELELEYFDLDEKLSYPRGKEKETPLKISIIQEVPEGKPIADRENILGIIKEIDNSIESKNWDKCQSLIIELRQICYKTRTGHIPELLDALDKYVKELELFESEKIREELALIMKSIIQNDRELGTTKTIEDITEKLIDAAGKIALYDRKTGFSYALQFFSETEDRRSVNIIIDVLTELDEGTFKNKEDFIHYVLFKSNLGRRQSEYIKEKLVELSSFKDEAVKSSAIRLLEKCR